jgi:hypothetical protein
VEPNDDVSSGPRAKPIPFGTIFRLGKVWRDAASLAVVQVQLITVSTDIPVS